MTWILVLAFQTCLGCPPEQIITAADHEWCMGALARYEAGDESSQTLVVEDGPDKGARYPVIGVWCMEPDDDIDHVPASYPQETP